MPERVPHDDVRRSRSSVLARPSRGGRRRPGAGSGSRLPRTARRAVGREPDLLLVNPARFVDSSSPAGRTAGRSPGIAGTPIGSPTAFATCWFTTNQCATERVDVAGCLRLAGRSVLAASKALPNGFRAPAARLGLAPRRRSSLGPSRSRSSRPRRSAGGSSRSGPRRPAARTRRLARGDGGGGHDPGRLDLGLDRAVLVQVPVEAVVVVPDRRDRSRSRTGATAAARSRRCGSPSASRAGRSPPRGCRSRSASDRLALRVRRPTRRDTGSRRGSRSRARASSPGSRRGSRRCRTGNGGTGRARVAVRDGHLAERRAVEDRT